MCWIQNVTIQENILFGQPMMEFGDQSQWWVQIAHSACQNSLSKLRNIYLLDLGRASNIKEVAYHWKSGSASNIEDGHANSSLTAL
jgi:hypothetical protein